MEYPGSRRRRALTCRCPPPPVMAAMIAAGCRRREIRLPRPCRCPTLGRSKLPAGGLGMDDLYLKSGIFLAPFHNHDENPTLSIERHLELLEHLDRLNYHEAW